MLRGVEAVVQDQRVVLVGDDELLLARHRAEREEAVGHRRRAELGLGQFEQALLEAAPDRRHRAADHVRAGVLAHHARKAGAHLGNQRGESSTDCWRKMLPTTNRLLRDS